MTSPLNHFVCGTHYEKGFLKKIRDSEEIEKG